MFKDRRAPGAGDATTTRARQGTPAKRTLTGALQRKTRTESAVPASSPPAPSPPVGPVDDPFWFATGRAVEGASTALPHLDVIQRSFGPHDVSSARAHVGGDAEAAATEIGAHAYTTGDRVAFASPPDLRLAAHEAAHVVHQRSRVPLASGIGAADDTHERHADAVADRVVRGESAVDLLDEYPAGGDATRGVVQRYPTSNQHNEPCPSKVLDAFGIALSIARKAALASATISNDQAYEKYFADPKAAAVHDKIAALVTQLEWFMKTGEVKVGSNPELKVETNGFRYVNESDPSFRPTAVASNLGSGTSALLTFYSAIKNTVPDKAAWTIIHEVSHATPAIQSSDYAYAWERAFPMLGAIAKQSQGGQDNNADTWTQMIFEIGGTKLPTPGREDAPMIDEFDGVDGDLERAVRQHIAIAEKGVRVSFDRLSRLITYLEKSAEEKTWLDYAGNLRDYKAITVDLPILETRGDSGPTPPQIEAVRKVCTLIGASRGSFDTEMSFKQVDEGEEPFGWGESVHTFITRKLLTIDEPLDLILTKILSGWAEDDTELCKDVVMSFLIDREWV
jgi:hypothetical protein